MGGRSLSGMERMTGWFLFGTCGCEEDCVGREDERWRAAHKREVISAMEVDSGDDEAAKQRLRLGRDVAVEVLCTHMHELRCIEVFLSVGSDTQWLYMMDALSWGGHDRCEYAWHLRKQRLRNLTRVTWGVVKIFGDECSSSRQL